MRRAPIARIESRDLGAERRNDLRRRRFEPDIRPIIPGIGRQQAPWYRRDAATSERRRYAPCSTTLPMYSTVTRSQIFATTPRSWETNSTLVP